MAIELDPGSAEAHNNLGSALQQKGRLEAAVLEYKIASTLALDNAIILFNIASVLDGASRGAEALVYFRRFVEADPAGYGPYVELARARIRELAGK